MDEKTLRILEFNKIRKILADYTSFSAGTDLAQSLKPTADPFEAQRWQAENPGRHRLTSPTTDAVK